MRIIYLGDVVARPGREVVMTCLPKLKELYKPDVIIINVENSAHGFGATPESAAIFLKKALMCW